MILSPLLNNLDSEVICWLGILSITIMMFSAFIVIEGKHYFSNKTRTIFLYIEIISAVLTLDVLGFIVTR